MAFVSELMPEEKKRHLPFDVATTPDGSRPTLWKWVVDADRDVYLVQVRKEGGGYEGTPEHGQYVLCWRGRPVPFGGSYIVSGSPVNGLVVSWTVDEIQVPPELRGLESDIKALINEALDAMGWLFSRERIRSVSVSFQAGDAQ